MGVDNSRRNHRANREGQSERTTPKEEIIYLDILLQLIMPLIRLSITRIYKGRDAPSRARQQVRAGDVLVLHGSHVPRKHRCGAASLRWASGLDGVLDLARAIRRFFAIPLFLFSNNSHFCLGLKRCSAARVITAVRDEDVRAQPIPLAPSAEQERIVAEIEQQLTRLDAGVAALKRAQANLKRYKAAVLKSACEGALVPQDPSDEPAAALLARILAARRAKWEADRRAKGKTPATARYDEPAAPHTDDLPDLPDGWCWTAVEQLAFVGTGATPLRSNKDYYQNGSIPWITSAAMNSSFVTNAEEYITDLALAETNAKIFPDRDIACCYVR